MSENYESNGPDNSESSVNQEEGDVAGMNSVESKDDLFLDASDDLDDARNADNRESVASNEAEPSYSEENNVVSVKENQNQNHLVETDVGSGSNHELERLRNLLEKTVRERDSIEKDYKEERETFARELANLRHQLKVLTNKDGELAEGFSEKEFGESDGKRQVGDAPLHELLSECSQFLRSALEERSKNESAIREINAVLYKKDREIEHLNAKVAEILVSHDVAAAYLNSAAGITSEAQIEKDQYVEVVADRMLSYLAMVVYQGELMDSSISGKISHVEQSTYMLIEKYNQMLYEIYQLGQCLSKPDPELRVQEQFETVFAAARDELLNLKRREEESVENLSHIENENRKLVEQAEKDREMVEAVNAELSKTKTELEHEKMKCTGTKEKLSLAVTKGKALVQQRDSLKQSLADKTIELEKCLAELQEKSSALQAAELSKEEFIKTENLVASLQETLQQSNLMLEKSEEVLAQIDIPEELQSLDMVERIKWLVSERHELKGISLDFYKLKDAVSLIDVPETGSFSDLESRLAWLKESFYQAKDEANVLLDQLNRTKEAARNEIDRLSGSLSAELQEKDYIQKELNDLLCKYEEIVEKANKISLEKDHMVRVLLKESGTSMEDQDVASQTSSDPTTIVSKCIGKIREQTCASSDTSGADSEMLQTMQSLLYVSYQELILCQQILEEDALVRLQLNDLSNKLRVASEEFGALKEEKESQQKDLERSGEKSALLREKLSLAVKKGKGLFQDRENLKLQLDEKNSEIEKLKLNLQEQESTISECRDQINRLSNDLDRIRKMEADLIAMKDERNQFEHFLLESNNMLQKVLETVDRIILPANSVFKEPLEKVNWIASYINECHDTKTQLEQELGNVKQEASALASELAETQSTMKSLESTMKSLEDALSVAEDKITQLADEKRQVEVGKKKVEEELEKAIEEAHIQTSKFAEACASRKSLEDEMSVAKNNMSVLICEKEEAQASGSAAVVELEQVREEFASQTSKLTEAYKTIKSLEDSLAQVEANVAVLTEQNNVLQVGKTTLENELQMLKDEAGSQAVKMADAHTTIKSMEDALLKAKNDISVLEGEKRISDQEVSALNSKLNACRDELAGTIGSLESRSVELIGHLNDLQMHMKDERLLSAVKSCFERKIEGLQNMELIVEDIRIGVVGKGSAITEGNSDVTKSFIDDIDNIEMYDNEVTVLDADDITSCFRKTAEGFQMRTKILTDTFEHFSVSIDEFIAALLRKLQTTRDEVVRMTQCMDSLRGKVKNLEGCKQEHEEAMVMLQNDATVLLSACIDATRELQFEVKNNLLELNSVPELENLNRGFSQPESKVEGNDTTDHQKSLHGNRYHEAAENLLFSASKVQPLAKLFEMTSTVAASTIQDLQKKLQDTTTAYEKVKDERDLHQNKVSKLESDVDALEHSCKELRLKVEDLEAKEEKLKENEAEISSLYDRLSRKEQEAEGLFLSPLQIRKLVDKISGIEIPYAESAGDEEPESSAIVKKLFSIINSATKLPHEIDLLEHGKQELQSILSTQTAEIEHLKGEVETHIRNKPDLEKMKIEFAEFTFGLEKIVNMLESNEFVVNQKSSGSKGLLAVLEKQIMTLHSDAENSKSKVQELGNKLLESQKVVDDLTTKVDLLEESLRGRRDQPEIAQERSIFEASSLPTGSEISEVEDVMQGTLEQKTISHVPSAAHTRTMRKGSTDHLTINIDSESARLINSEETDEDKGHVFKSLNTLGLIPRQGKMVADRIDGIWVSGGRLLMSRPGTRLGLIAYSLLLHIWLLGTIL
ncbi:hypothetical protein AB3S75_038363 [Citrus x aurantiifolia]